MTEPNKLPPSDLSRDVPSHQPAAGGIAARARASAAPQYLTALNPEQREAVETLDGPVLVLAGAGTGKTRVLTSRIAHILSTGRARPHEILSVTFTNKAAREMKHRLGQMLGQAVEGMPWLGTFHSIGGRILRYHAELVQLKSNFTVLDVDDQIRLLKQLLQAENIDDKRWPARMLAGLIDGWKNRGLTPSQVPAGEAAVFGNGKGGKLYASYQERLKILNAADFGDLLLENIRLFREHPDVLRQYQQRFKYILVDEYQDTNVAQYLWLRLLAQAPSSASSLPGLTRQSIIFLKTHSGWITGSSPVMTAVCVAGSLSLIRCRHLTPRGSPRRARRSTRGRWHRSRRRRRAGQSSGPSSPWSQAYGSPAQSARRRCREFFSTWRRNPDRIFH